MSHSQYDEYHLKTSVAKIILQENGHIFGGYVRDKMLHDIHAQKFYKKHPLTTNNADDANTLYTNQEIEPDLLGRLVCANDIDCYMTSESLKATIKKIRDSELTIHKLFERDPKEYLPNLNIPQGCMLHSRYRVNMWSQFKLARMRSGICNVLHNGAVSILSKEINDFLKIVENKVNESNKKLFPSVYIDIFIPVNDADFSKYEAPFSNLDFECNGLIYTKHGIHMSKSIFNRLQEEYLTGTDFDYIHYPAIFDPLQNFQKLQKILDDIDNKNAIVVNTNVSQQRISKMIGKGWTLSSNQLILSPIIKTNAAAVPENDKDSDDSEENSCIICHEKFTKWDVNSNLGPAYKLRCCEARYHLKCIIRSCTDGPAAIETTTKCIMCRQFTDIYTEKQFMENLYEQIKLINRPRRRRIEFGNGPIPRNIADLPIPIPIDNIVANHVDHIILGYYT
jgi:hypothetical protein